MDLEVVCSAEIDGRIIEKTVTFPSLTTSIHLSGWILKNLKEIDLKQLTQFQYLRELTISHTIIEEIDLSPLSQCQRLTSLDLRRNKLTRIVLAPLSKCRVLEHLSLAYNNIQEIDLSGLFSCENISSINLRNNPLERVDLSPLIFHLYNGVFRVLGVDGGVQIIADVSLYDSKWKPSTIGKKSIHDRIEWIEDLPKKREEKSDSTGQEGTFDEDRHGVKVGRDISIEGGHIEFKIKISNESNYVITNIHSNIVAYPQDCLEIQGSTSRTVNRIEINGFRSLSFIFLPTLDCVQGKILSSVNYVDHKDQLHSIEVKPKEIRSICDMLQPLYVTVENFTKLLDEFVGTQEELTAPWNAEFIFETFKTILPSKNFAIIHTEKQNVGGQFIGLIKGLAKGKHSGKKVAIQISVIGAHENNLATINLTALGEDEASLPTAIRELMSEIIELKESIEILVQGTSLLMKAAGESIISQRRMIESLMKLEQKADTTSLLTKDIVRLVNVLYDNVRGGQKSLEDTLEEMSSQIDKIAEKIGIDKTLRERITDTLKETLLEEAKKGVLEKLKERISIPILASLFLTILKRLLNLLGLPIP